MYIDIVISIVLIYLLFSVNKKLFLKIWNASENKMNLQNILSSFMFPLYYVTLNSEYDKR